MDCFEHSHDHIEDRWSSLPRKHEGAALSHFLDKAQDTRECVQCVGVVVILCTWQKERFSTGHLWNATSSGFALEIWSDVFLCFAIIHKVFGFTCTPRQLHRIECNDLRHHGHHSDRSHVSLSLLEAKLFRAHVGNHDMSTNMFFTYVCSDLNCLHEHHDI